jgi:YfiH family protein
MTSESAGVPLTPPAVPESFYWTTEAWGSALRCRPLQAIAPHLFTTRQLQLTDPRDVQRLASSLGVRQVVMVTQVHQADVVVVRKDGSSLDGRREADVLVSNDPDVAIAVRAADCVPILIADRATGSVAAVHAGWRGTAAGAVSVAVAALKREFACDPANLLAAIGPSIGSCCYEVGSELVDTFARAGHERYLIDRWFLARPWRRESRERSPLHLDVAGANRDQLVLAGVPEESLFMSGLCTAMNLGVLTSFRVEREQAGRIAGVIAARRL